MKAIQVNATRGNRSLTERQSDGAATLRNRRIVLANPVLLLPRRMIDTAIAEAKKTRYGLPTDAAICQRWWIADNRPARGDRSKIGRMLYAVSFESCCELLDLDVDEERKRAIAEIDDSNVRDAVLYAGNVMYQRRAAVLRCAGVTAAVGRQYVLGLVDVTDYDEVADPVEAAAAARGIKRDAREATKTAKRRKLIKAG